MNRRTRRLASSAQPTVTYGASWFLLVNDTITGTFTPIPGSTIPASMRVIMVMNNMDPASLEGEGEYSGLAYETHCM